MFRAAGLFAIPTRMCAIALTLAACAVGTPLTAQQAGAPTASPSTEVTPHTPAACEADANRQFNAAFESAMDSVGRKFIANVNYAELARKRAQWLGACALRLDANNITGTDLVSLARILAQGGENDKAFAAVKRFARDASVPDSARASALLSVMRVYLGTEASRLPQAEVYADALDALPNTVRAQKWDAHESLYAAYRYLDIDVGVRKHALAIIALAHNVKAHVRTNAEPTVPPDKVEASRLIMSYMNAAIVYANFGEEKTALKLLEQGRRDHSEIDPKYLDGAFSGVTARIHMIGKPATAIPSDHWFNAPEGTTALSFRDKVTIVGFTAHWCLPCVTSYVPLQAMSDSLGPRGAQFMFATQYYGYVGAARKLTEEQETIATREYYTLKRGIRFPVALIGHGIDPAQPTPPAIDASFEFYKVEQIPQSVVIDRKGTIRRFILGWDPANSVRLPALVVSLLREK